tara:strand:- start:5292 stop:5801 length:510 start_codon:yes stop_codon:yes gene_type:complete
MSLSPELLRALSALDGAGVSSPLGPYVSKELKLGEFYRRIVLAGITLTNAIGGGTTAPIVVQLTDHLGNAIDRERQVLLRIMGTQYDPADENATATLASAAGEPGSVVASATGWALIQTDATGKFEGTLTNAADETVYVSAGTPTAGVSDTSKACLVIGCVSEDVTWSA